MYREIIENEELKEIINKLKKIKKVCNDYFEESSTCLSCPFKLSILDGNCKLKGYPQEWKL